MNRVLAVLEQRNGVLNRASIETLAAAQAIATPVTALLLGAEIDSLAAELQAQCSVIAIAAPALAEYTPDAFTAAAEQLLRAKDFTHVLFPHTYQVRDWAPKLAARFGQVLVSDVIAVRMEAGAAIFVRQLFQGKLNADVTVNGGLTFASVQAGAFPASDYRAAAGALERFSVTLPEPRTKPEAPFQETARAVDLTAAPVIVSVGRGIREKENLPVIEELAAAIGGEMAASRPICDNGWLPMERQVGSSGQTVAPKVYFAIGISGAIQHMVGMKGSKTIVAINKDADAPIFEIADYGIVGDLFEIVPALTEAVRKMRS